MSKPQRLTRRGFIAAAAAAPVALKAGATQTLAAQVEQAVTAGLAQAGIGVAKAAPHGWALHSLVSNPTLMGLYKAGLLPDWLSEEIERSAIHEAAGRMDPSVACLRSVSLTAKFRMQNEYAVRRMWSMVDSVYARQLARAQFYGNNPG